MGTREVISASEFRRIRSIDDVRELASELSAMVGEPGRFEVERIEDLCKRARVEIIDMCPAADFERAPNGAAIVAVGYAYEVSRALAFMIDGARLMRPRCVCAGNPHIECPATHKLVPPDESR